MMIAKVAPQSCKQLSRVEWQEVKAAYQRGEGSCAELAEQFGVTPVSVQNRCKRGGWRKELVALDRVVGQIVTEDLAERGFGLAERRQRFLERTMDESESWLDEIVEAKKLLRSEDIDGLRKLVSAWQVPVEVGRKAYGLNAEEKNATSQTLVNIAMMNTRLNEPVGRPIKTLPIDA